MQTINYVNVLNKKKGEKRKKKKKVSIHFDRINIQENASFNK